MKRFLFALLVCLFFFFPSPAFAQSDWVITNFGSNLDIQSDGTVKVTEVIETDFAVQKHGIYRTIPIRYQDDSGEKTYTEITVNDVLQDGNPAEYKEESDENNLFIRVGDPSRTISGRHSYLITYTARGVIRSFSDYDELYWNVTGNGWDAAIENASATIHLPSGEILKTACFEGSMGSKETCTISKNSAKEAYFTTTQALIPYEGLTVAAGFTKGIVPILTVAPPRDVWKDLFTPASYLEFFFALGGGIILSYLLWMKKGRDFWYHTRRQLDPNAKEETMPVGAPEPVVVEFESPEKLRPAELGVLMDEKADTLDVTATIIDLANRGFLTIKEIDKKWLFGSKDYELKRTQLKDDKLLSYEKYLLDRLFASGETIKVSELKKTFYEDLAKVKTKLYEEVMKKKLFVENPESRRLLFFGIAWGVGLIGGGFIYLGFFTKFAVFVSFGVGMIISAILLLFIARIMPRRTAYGHELYQRVKGYQLFISSAEKYRQQFFEKKNMFNEVLPYAIVFGLTGKFAQAMKDMGVQPSNPVWYSGGHVFNPVIFATDVNSFSKSLSSAIASTPSSSGSGGGGFSGGGFGGGGGGSW